MKNILQQAQQYYEFCKEAYIKKLPNGQYRVVSEKGKNLGTYETKNKAKKRLQEVEYFKHNKDKNKADVDLTDLDELTYSAVVRKLRKNKNDKQTTLFLKLFKKEFDKAINKELQQPEKVALQNTLVKYNKIYKIKLSKKLLKNAAITELGDAKQIGKYLSNVVKFVLTKVPPEHRLKATEKVKEKIRHLSESDLTVKKLPYYASIGQSITFIKHVLFNQNPHFIKEVIDHIVRNL